MSRRRVALIALSASAALSGVAVAATPDSGTIGTSAPKVSWEGTSQSSGIFYNAWTEDPSIECEAPACDKFNLTVADGGYTVQLTYNILTTNADGSDPGAGIRVRFPDGSYQYTQGNASEKNAMKLRLKAAKAGDYEIALVASHVCCGDDPYKASAEILELASAPAPAPAPGPQPAAPQQPAPQPAAPQLTVSPTKASAKKIARAKRYTVKVSTTAPLTGVTGALLKGNKALATAKLARLQGSANLVLRLARKAKVKAGTHTVRVSGTDEQGRKVTTTVKVRVAR